jgi:hypothetical protein
VVFVCESMEREGLVDVKARSTSERKRIFISARSSRHPRASSWQEVRLGELVSSGSSSRGSRNIAWHGQVVDCDRTSPSDETMILKDRVKFETSSFEQKRDLSSSPPVLSLCSPARKTRFMAKSSSNPSRNPFSRVLERRSPHSTRYSHISRLFRSSIYRDLTSTDMIVMDDG